MSIRPIPCEKDWEGWTENADVQYAYELYFGKCNTEMMDHLKQCWQLKVMMILILTLQVVS